MKQAYENNKRRIQTFKLTADLKDDNGVVHHFIDGYEYVEIGGLKWATCNVGAEKETDWGLYFAWGETVGYKNTNEKHFTLSDYEFWGNGNILKYNMLDGLTKLEPCDDAATQNMGENWRMPTKDEFRALLSATTKKWTRVNGVKGRLFGVNGWLFTDKTDDTKELFFPAVGLCYNGSVYYVNYSSFYWSSSLDTSNIVGGWGLCFDSGGCLINTYCRNLGFSVRGVIK